MFGFGKKKTDPEPEAKPKRDLIKVSVPFEEPPSYLKPPEETKLSEEELEKYNTVLKHFQDPDLKVPSTEHHHKGALVALSKDQKAWLTRECFLRYLRASKWHVESAIKRIEGTLGWRKEFGIESMTDESENIVTSELVSPESETGKEVILGFDNQCRPCLYLKPGRQNTKTSFRQVQHLVFFLERVIDFMPSGQDSLALLIDFKNHPEIAAQAETSKVPPLTVGKQVLHILQTHYPERLGKALLTNIPFLGRTFLRLIYPFIDPLTKEKLVFDADFADFCPAEQLDKEFDGLVDFEYDHEVYFPALVEMAKKKQAHYIARFEEFGGVVGLSEIDLRGNGPITVPVGSHPFDTKVDGLAEKTAKLTVE
ncbi:hypothetical protein OGAPHI_000367 [Ogataea philodendri]|uniref:SEC14 homolog 3 n=1 Tax=Ogataea philodendri TaxID=1378263 RepID=A0A9P8PH16_9ASCO|nr:uncharacterized protein OGAPHI_000367 [Ogataea philodendri]KAH3671662.1 hypothetical protein OGAPHI_000367 [Ogataea philodendri]